MGVNANVNAEMKRMMKIGNDRYAEHLKKDADLKNLIDSNKAATDARLKAMGAHYKMDIDQALHEAKDEFAQKLGALHKTVVDNDKAFEGKIHKLTGIVDANAQKNEKERQILRKMMETNKKELEGAVSDAVRKGEQRMQAAQDKLTAMNEATKSALNLKITGEISKLEKEANSQIEGLRLQSKEARAAMKAELLYAIRSMADEAKSNLDDAVEVAKGAFTKANDDLAAEADKAADARAAIATEVAIQKENARKSLADAVATMHESLVSLKHETEEKIKKTNTDVAAYAKALGKEAKDVSALMAQQMTSLTGKIEALKEKTAENLAAADAASAAGFSSAMDEVESALKEAEEVADDKFSKLQVEMADQRAELDTQLAASVDKINDSIAKQAALADSRFSKTVKDIAAAREEAASEVKLAREEFATGLLAVSTQIEAMDTKLTNQVQVVSGAVISHAAAQHRVNLHVAAEIKRIEGVMNHRASVSKLARGKLRAILDENKRAAADEVKALDGLFKTKITSIKEKAKANAEDAKDDLEKKSEEMFEKLADAQAEQLYANEQSAQKIGEYSKEAQAAIAASQEDFTSRLGTLANTVAANHKQMERNFEELSGVIRTYEEAGDADRALNTAMTQKIADAIQVGEAKATAVANRAREHLAGAKKAMLIEITNTVEGMADAAFKTIQGNHQKLADNYLSLKAYAVTADAEIKKYVAAGKGRNLSSLGDLLQSIASLSDVVAQKAEGLSPSDSIPAIFSTEKIKVDNSISKIHGLVNEYTQVTTGARARWPMGLGKYLLLKLEQSMVKKGVLQVDKVDGKSGNWVFVNGHAVGLSNKLNDFETLAVRMGHYEATLAKLTAELSGKVKPGAAAKKQVFAKKYWPGDR